MLPDFNSTIKPNKQPLTAALYARVSTGRQEQEATIESQLDEIKTRIQADGNVLPQENIFIDDGWTGEVLPRPCLDVLRDAVQIGSFQILYVYDRGRIARKFSYQELVIEELSDKDIQFVTLHDINAQTPEEQVLQAMQGVFHEYERVKIAERMRRGKLFKARNKILINGHSLYGWDYIKKVERADKTIIPAHYRINEEQAKVVRWIWEWVGIERISLNEVIRRLYDRCIPPRKGKSEFWTKGPIVRLLQNEAYAKGVVYYNKSESCVAKKPIKNIKYKKIKRTSKRPRPREEWIPFKVDPIIKDDGLFEKVQIILQNNQKYARKNRKYSYLLSGLIFCECGNRRAGDGSSKYGHFYYRCAERIYSFPLEKKCKSQGINAEMLDTLIWKKLAEYLSDPQMLRTYAEKWLKDQARFENADTIEKNRLINQLDQLKEEEGRYTKAYGAGALEFEQFKDSMRDVAKRKISIQAQIDELDKTLSAEVDQFQVDDICYEAEKVLKSLDLSNKVQVIKDIIDRVIIQKGVKEVEVWGHVPVVPTLNQKLGYEPESRDSWTS